MNFQEIKGFVELMKDIDSRGNLAESSKGILPYMIYLIENVEKAKGIFVDIKSIQTWEDWHIKDLDNRIADFLDKLN